jgi:Domain of unknown function (DUF4410)
MLFRFALFGRSRAPFRNPDEGTMTHRRKKICGILAAAAWLTIGACAQTPLSAKVNVTSISVYTGSTPLPKPAKILVYDFAINTDDVQVDKLQSMRPRHLITGDKKPDAVAASANKKFSAELVKALAKTGIPVEHVATGTTAADNQMAVQGSFTSLKEGTKAERDTVGMGLGAANVQTNVDVHVKKGQDMVLLSQFSTDMKPGANTGSVLPVAAGLDPAAVVAKSTVMDRRKTLNAYASKTADATAKEILKSMAAQGWVKTNDKGELAE